MPTAKSAFPKRLSFWSAACSSGQEAYSLAITLREMLHDVDDWDIQILASDISSTAIEQASRGVYSDHEISRGLAPAQLNRYFQRRGGQWHVDERLRSMIRFEQRNLLKPFPSVGPFDIVFCRNIAIYFSDSTRKQLFQRLAERIRHDGFLFIGAQEFHASMAETFTMQQHCRASCYQPKSTLSAT